MFQKFTTLILASGASLACAQVPGGYSKADVTPENVAPLKQALASASGYNDPSKAICFEQVKQVETQVVAGQNYKYTVKGCKLPAGTYFSECQSRKFCCNNEFYDVVVFSQPWSNTLTVTLVQPVPQPK